MTTTRSLSLNMSSAITTFSDAPVKGNPCLRRKPSGWQCSSAAAAVQDGSLSSAPANTPRVHSHHIGVVFSPAPAVSVEVGIER